MLVMLVMLVNDNAYVDTNENGPQNFGDQWGLPQK
ncbi:MAG: hypothetical protein K0Q59_5963, partial [Paenibacillus sp.]|nr:hypothetical protein [Paenibacillus sp.]